MRVIALLALLIGVTLQLLLNGQPFSTALGGIVCGLVAAGAGAISAYSDRPRRAMGQFLTGAGLALVLMCLVQLPSAQRFQENFNSRLKAQPAAD